MATLEDAAEDLVVKLKGLDSEIEESEQKLEDFRDKVADTAADLEKDWTTLTEAVKSLMETVQDQQERLDQQAQETMQGLADAQNAVTRDGAEARGEIAEGKAKVDALAAHAAGLESPLESLASEAGEAPPHALAQRAHDLQQELSQAVDDARAFLQDEVVPAMEQAATDVHEQCEELHRALAEQHAAALQQAYDDWESKIDQLEQYVATQGFQASHQHAHDVVDYALDECDTACKQKLDEVQQLVGVLVTQLKELASEVTSSADTLVSQAGAELLHALEQAHSSGTGAVTALDQVKQRLASYSFVEM